VNILALNWLRAPFLGSQILARYFRRLTVAARCHAVTLETPIQFPRQQILSFPWKKSRISITYLDFAAATKPTSLPRTAQRSHGWYRENLQMGPESGKRLSLQTGQSGVGYSYICRDHLVLNRLG
jgi:hypothetical protein